MTESEDLTNKYGASDRKSKLKGVSEKDPLVSNTTRRIAESEIGRAVTKATFVGAAKSAVAIP